MTKPDNLSDRVYVLEAKDEIRRLMAAYVHARDVTGDSVADYFTSDAVWEGIGVLADAYLCDAVDPVASCPPSPTAA